MINCTFFDNVYSFYHQITITLSYVRNVTMIKKSLIDRSIIFATTNYWYTGWTPTSVRVLSLH